jgi:hypothetical protein
MRFRSLILASSGDNCSVSRESQHDHTGRAHLPYRESRVSHSLPHSGPSSLSTTCRQSDGPHPTLDVIVIVIVIVIVNT